MSNLKQKIVGTIITAGLMLTGAGVAWAAPKVNPGYSTDQVAQLGSGISASYLDFKNPTHAAVWDRLIEVAASTGKNWILGAEYPGLPNSLVVKMSSVANFAGKDLRGKSAREKLNFIKDNCQGKLLMQSGSAKNSVGMTDVRQMQIPTNVKNRLPVIDFATGQPTGGDIKDLFSEKGWAELQKHPAYNRGDLNLLCINDFEPPDDTDKCVSKDPCDCIKGPKPPRCTPTPTTTPPIITTTPTGECPACAVAHKGPAQAAACEACKNKECMDIEPITDSDDYGWRGTSPGPQWFVNRAEIDGDVWGVVDIFRQFEAIAGSLHDQSGIDHKTFTPFYQFSEDIRNRAAHQGTSAIAGRGGQIAKPTAPPLDSTNRRGMSFGGVLNYKAWALHRHVKAYDLRCHYVPSAHFTYHQVWDSCKHLDYYKSGGYWRSRCVGGYVTKRKFSHWNEADDITNKSWIEREYRVDRGFWQQMAVHCNKIDFDRAKNELASKVSAANVDGAGGKNYATLITKDLGAGASPILGKPTSHASSGIGLTGTKGFYTKECPFDCELTNEQYTDGADDKNVLSPGDLNNHGNKGGAIVGNNGEHQLNSNYAEHFRDNRLMRIRVGYWKPKVGNGVLDSPDAITTTIRRWEHGTPSIESKDWNIYDHTKSQGFFTSNDSPAPEQKNWDISPFASKYYSIRIGTFIEFFVKGSWASDTHYPNILNIKWEFRPQVDQKVFDRPGMTVPTTGSVISLPTAIEGKCYANFGTHSSLDTTQMFHDNTGEGVVNNLDNSILPCSNLTDKPALCRNHLVINTIRATAR